MVRIEFVGIATHLGPSVGHSNPGDEDICPDIVVKGAPAEVPPWGVCGHLRQVAPLPSTCPVSILVIWLLHIHTPGMVSRGDPRCVEVPLSQRKYMYLLPAVGLFCINWQSVPTVEPLFPNRMSQVCV